MASHAWLEQKNRRLLDLSEGDGSRVAIEATPDDYEAAYRIFNKVCRRTVVNLSDTHRKILGSLHDLHGEFPNREGFTQREIAEGAKVSLSTVSDNKTFLATSAKFIKQTESGLALVEGADPSWWATGDIMAGLPTPEKVRSWWEDRDPPPEGAEQAEHAAEANRKRHTYAGNGVRHPSEQEPNTFGVQAEGAERGDGGPEHVRRVFGNTPNAENGLGKAESVTGEAMFGVFGGFEGNPQESVSERASKGNWASGVNAVPVSFDARPGEMPTVAEPRDRRERQEGSGEERVRAVAEGLHRLFQEYPEYRERRPGQIGCRLYMSQYTPFVPKDEEVEAAMTEAL